MARGRRPAASGNAWHSARKCTVCGDPYTRRCLNEEWDTRNEGHRDGWHKTVAKVCLKCRSVEKSKRVLVLAGVQLAPATTAPKAAPKEKSSGSAA